MDWQKQDLAELKYYCTSTRSRVPRHFQCYPFSWQIDVIMNLFFYYSITEFQIGDIKDFYKTLRIPKPRSEGLRNPSPAQITKALERMENVRRIGEDRFQILGADAHFSKFYAEELKYGYEKGYVQYFMEEHICGTNI